MHGNQNTEKVKAKKQPKDKLRSSWKVTRRKQHRMKLHTQDRMLGYGQTT